MRNDLDILVNNIQKIVRKKDVTNLGIYLASREDPRALNILRILIKGIQYDKFHKKIDVNFPMEIINKGSNGAESTHQENIISSLVGNQLCIAKELLDYIVKTEKVDFEFKSYGIVPIWDKITITLKEINKKDSSLYKRKDIAEIYLGIIDYLLENGIIDSSKKGFYCYSGIENELLNYIKNNPNDQDMRRRITTILYNQRKNVKTYEDVIAFNLDKEHKSWNSIAEAEASNISMSSCQYLLTTLAPIIKSKKPLSKRF